MVNHLCLVSIGRSRTVNAACVWRQPVLWLIALAAMCLCKVSLVAAPPRFLRPQVPRHNISRLQSPPLSAAGGLSLVIEAPQDWKIGRQDPTSNWKMVSYDFEMDGPRDGQTSGRRIEFEVLQWVTSRAERKGALSGSRFETRSGRVGEITSDSWDSNYSQYLAFRFPRQDMVIVLRAIYSTARRTSTRGVVMKVFKRARFVKLG